MTFSHDRKEVSLLPEADFLRTRTVLYRLEPIARGTSQRESLTSLGLRLANAHHLGVLRFSELIADRMGIRAPSVNHAIDRTFGDGGGQMALLLSHALATLTGHMTLSDLTFLPIGAAKTSARLTPSVYRWCPQCFREDMASGRPPYGRLIWSSGANDICPIHRLLLCSQCLECLGRPRRQNIQALPNACRRCGADLLAAKPSGDPSPEQIRRGDLTAAMLDDPRFSSLTGETASEGAFEFVSQAVEQHFEGKYSRLARYLGVSLLTVRSWVMRENVPTIQNIVLLADALHAPLIDIYHGDVCRIVVDPQPRIRKTKRRRAIRRGSASEARVAGHLERLTAGKPNLTIKQVAADLNVSVHYLTARFPERCRQLREGLLQSQEQARIALREKTCARFRELAEEIAWTGRVPSVRSVFEIDSRFRARRVGFLTDRFNQILADVRGSMHDGLGAGVSHPNVPLTDGFRTSLRETGL